MLRILHNYKESGEFLMN